MGGADHLLPPDDDPERLATIRRLTACPNRDRIYDLERRAHDPSETRDPLERSVVAEGVLGLACLAMVLFGAYGVWCAARDLFRLIH